MTRCKYFIVMAVFGALVCGSAYGGLARHDGSVTPVIPRLVPHGELTGGSEALGRRAIPIRAPRLWVPSARLDVVDGATCTEAGSALPGRVDVLRQVPPAPSSFALGLTALAGLGLYQAGRRVQLARLPEWYHTGGPQQVGYATPLAIDSWELSGCSFAVPQPVIHRCVGFAVEAMGLTPREVQPHVTAPRGPPAISSIC